MHSLSVRAIIMAALFLPLPLVYSICVHPFSLFFYPFLFLSFLFPVLYLLQLAHLYRPPCEFASLKY